MPRSGMRGSMSITRRTLIVITVVVSLAAYAAADAVATTRTSGHRAAAALINWPAFLHGADHSSMNAAATAITPVTAPVLTKVWTWKPAGPTMQGQPKKGLLASPTVVNGRVYEGAETGVFYALSLK